jgi:hypothetical protein
VGPRTSCYTSKDRKISCLCRDSNDDFSGIPPYVNHCTMYGILVPVFKNLTVHLVILKC